MHLTKSLGVLVIGDEILRGDVIDTNFAFVSKTAPSYGLKLAKVTIIPDVVEVIAKEVKNFSLAFDAVVTSGGIGPTHDDQTFEGIAAAFSEPLELNPSLVECVASLLNCNVNDLTTNESLLRLTRIPSSSKLIYGDDPKTGRPAMYPVIKVHNIYILPGVPDYFQRGFSIIRSHICDADMQFFRKSLYLTCDETSLAKCLSDFAETHKETLSIGSYPVTNNNYYQVRVSIESQNQSILDEQTLALQKMLVNELTDYEPDPVSIASVSVYQLAEGVSDFGRKLTSSISLIEKTICDYGENKITLSFNGGKDCTALLHLYFAVLNKHTSNSNALIHPRLFYVRTRTPFPEVESFIQSALKFYRYPSASIAKRHFIPSNGHNNISKHSTNYSNDPHLDIYEGPIKASLERLSVQSPQLEAILMGTRSSDLWAASASVMMKTDAGWPPYMRINPILDWTYADVWRFIRKLSIPYCSLYDCGYTSLGSMEDTHPNPELRVVSSTGLISFRPAYTLENPLSERTGRLKST